MKRRNGKGKISHLYIRCYHIIAFIIRCSCGNILKIIILKGWGVHQYCYTNIFNTISYQKNAAFLSSGQCLQITKQLRSRLQNNCILYSIIYLFPSIRMIFLWTLLLSNLTCLSFILGYTNFYNLSQHSIIQVACPHV